MRETVRRLVDVNGFNKAMRLLQGIAKDEGLDAVSVFVRQDGRVDVYGAGEVVTRWWVEGDLLPGGALPTPGDALAMRQAAQPESADR